MADPQQQAKMAQRKIDLEAIARNTRALTAPTNTFSAYGPDSRICQVASPMWHWPRIDLRAIRIDPR